MVLYLHVFQYIKSAPIIKLNSPTLVQRSYLVNIIMSYIILSCLTNCFNQGQVSLKSVELLQINEEFRQIFQLHIP